MLNWTCAARKSYTDYIPASDSLLKMNQTKDKLKNHTQLKDF